jgi:protein-tyrosine phosphatase
MVKVMFICLGNICRSPAAEGILQTYIKQNNLENDIQVSSSGTSAFNVGSPADHRMVECALSRGYSLNSISQQFTVEDFKNFNYLITMDRSNFNNVTRLAQSSEDKNKVLPFAHFCVENSINEIPDPYREGIEGFELVLDLLEDGCQGILARIREEHEL